MKKIMTIKVAGGKYKDKEGREKTRWLDIGALFSDGRKRSIKLDSVPLGWDGWASLYLIESKSDKQPSQPTNRQERQHFDDDIPF